MIESIHATSSRGFFLCVCEINTSPVCPAMLLKHLLLTMSGGRY